MIDISIINGKNKKTPHLFKNNEILARSVAVRKTVFWGKNQELSSLQHSHKSTIQVRIGLQNSS